MGSLTTVGAGVTTGLLAAEVASLVSDGITNREIADRLFLSPHTVNSHLVHIYTKLAINSRAELARIVAEQEGGTRVPTQQR